MSMCACGSEIESSGPGGRPRKYCLECSPRHRDLASRVETWCVCGVAIDGRHGRKYCSDECRVGARSVPCASCGRGIRRSLTSAVVAYCLECRAAGLAPSSAAHGSSRRYKTGCRCDMCVSAHTSEGRAYTARRKAVGRPVDYRAGRKTDESMCADCGESFAAEVGRARQFCSVECAKRSQGWDGEHRDRWRPSAKLRRSIIERDGGVCQLCFAPVREDVEPAHPRYPHLDHITPRSRGGADSEDNLRLLCAQCNVTRGARVDWVPEVVAGDATGRLATAV